ARSGGERMAELQGGPSAQTTSDESPRRRRIADYAPDTFARVEGEIVANMERWRWMPRELSATRIEVNIPDFELTLVRDGQPAYRSRVIVGKATTPTPIFSNAMRFITVNPYWNVPPSILKNEMLGRHGGDLSYLAQRGFDVSYSNGRPFVRQRPGERNALGRIKFIFPNQYSVYMHDTPTRNLFAQSKRAFSHGCMRVDQPFRLAEAVLGPESGWTEEHVRALIGRSERTIDLAEPLPVHIEYFTAFVDENGALQLRDDIYGHSAKVRTALGSTAARTIAR
ncbi:MAG: L,D-transpeptidase, partial [Methylocystaceae bacterium]